MHNKKKSDLLKYFKGVVFKSCNLKKNYVISGCKPQPYVELS